MKNVTDLTGETRGNALRHGRGNVKNGKVAPRHKQRREPTSLTRNNPPRTWKGKQRAVPGAIGNGRRGKGRDLGAAKERSKVSIKTDLQAQNARASGTTNAIDRYLREIGKVKLLTPEEEVKLAARIKRGDKKARDHMIQANLRLVVKIAHDYEGMGLPLLDLINEGNLGLMKAVERFDPAKGGKLSTYGSWWIKQSIKRALANQSKTIRLPVHLVDKISKLRRANNRLQEELGREPTNEELAGVLDFRPEFVANLRSVSMPPSSLDAPLGDEYDSHTFMEIVEDEKAESPYDALQSKTMSHLVKELVKTLDHRESTILKHRFGLDGCRRKTLDEVGHKFGVTRERVRQLQNLALAKLRQMINNRETFHNGKGSEEQEPLQHEYAA